MFNGWIKKALQRVGFGTLPAAITFFCYLFFLIKKAQETDEAHREAVGEGEHECEDSDHESKVSSTGTIHGQLRKNSSKVKRYLALNARDEESANVSSSKEEQEQELAPRDDEPVQRGLEQIMFITESIQHVLGKDSSKAKKYLDQLEIGGDSAKLLLSNGAGPVALYVILEELYQKIYPPSVHYGESAFYGVLHGLAHLNEALLLRYFADMNFFDVEERLLYNLIGLCVIMAGVLSSVQSFYFSIQEKKPSSDELLKGISKNFLKFREEPQRRAGLWVREPLTLDARTRNQIRQIAANDVIQQCSMGCR